MVTWKKGYLNNPVSVDEKNDTETVRGGITQDHKYILMNDAKDSKMNIIHEIFHTLGVDKDRAKKGIGRYTHYEVVCK